VRGPCEESQRRFSDVRFARAILRILGKGDHRVEWAVLVTDRGRVVAEVRRPGGDTPSMESATDRALRRLAEGGGLLTRLIPISASAPNWPTKRMRAPAEPRRCTPPLQVSPSQGARPKPRPPRTKGAAAPIENSRLVDR